MAATDLATEGQINALVSAIAAAVSNSLSVGDTLTSLDLDVLGGPVLRIELVGSDGSTPNALEFRYDGDLTAWHNEFGEIRGQPSATSRVAARWFGLASQTANILEIMDDRTNRNVIMAVESDGTVTAPNIGEMVVVYDDTTTPSTSGVPAGTLFVGYDADG